MKNIILNLLSVNILSIVGLVGAISSDCNKLNSFLENEVIPCCDGKKIKCDGDGFITRIELGNTDVNQTLDFSHFPIFDKLYELNIGIENLFPPNELPSRFFDQPALDILTVYSSHISIIPNRINQKCPVSEINLEHNELNVFPTQFKDLPKLEHLYLWDNQISGEVDLDGFNALNQIDLGKNKVTNVKNIPESIQMFFVYENTGITKIPEEIPFLPDLTHLNFANTSITELPPDIFKLRLNNFKIDGNKNLKTKIINFGNKNVRECTFKDVQIECYEEGTCANMDVANNFKPCSESDINEIKSKQTKENPKSKSTNNNDKTHNTALIIGGIIGFIILLPFMFAIIRKFKKRSSGKNDSTNSDNKYDIIVKEKITKINIDDDINIKKEKVENLNPLFNSQQFNNSPYNVENKDEVSNIVAATTTSTSPVYGDNKKSMGSPVITQAQPTNNHLHGIDITNNHTSFLGPAMPQGNYYVNNYYQQNGVNNANIPTSGSYPGSPTFSVIDNIASGSNYNEGEALPPSYESLHSNVKINDSKPPLN